MSDINRSQIDFLKNKTLPTHIAIIMDGNGRWAQKRKYPRTMGHKEGLTIAKKIVKAAAAIGIKYITLYTFSTENWKRSATEVGYLMGLIKNHLRAEFQFYKSNNIRIMHIGNLMGLPQEIQSEIIQATSDTSHFKGTSVVLAINYGGRDEILRGIQKLQNDKTIKSHTSITEEQFSQYLDEPNLPDVDLLIRTGGEQRISNFLLWQSNYAELLFTDTLWPDYNEDEFYENIKTYLKRNRRFGSVTENKDINNDKK